MPILMVTEVGVAIGKKGTYVAWDSSDMVLGNDDFAKNIFTVM